MIRCPECGKRMYRDRRFYRCDKCKVKHQCHPDGTPTGFPGNKQVRLLRGKAHWLLNQVWDYADQLDRARMYKWIAEHGSKHHIGQMNKEELDDLISKIPPPREVRQKLWDQLAQERLSRGSSGTRTEELP